MHAREPYSFLFIKALFQQIIKRNHQFQFFMNNGVFIFYPFVNIDAYKVYQTSTEVIKDSLRKNMNIQNVCNLGGIGGVDINRNFPAQFSTVPQSQNPCGQQYHGKYAFSQRQAHVFKSIYQKFKIIIAIDIHSYGNQWIYPYASDLTGKKIKNHSLYQFYKIVVQQLRNNDKKIKSCSQALGYIADGVYIDWALNQNALSLAYQIGKTFHSDSTAKIQADIQTAIQDFFMIFKKLALYNYEVKKYSDKITIKSKTLLVFNMKINISSNYYQKKLTPGQEFSFNRNQNDDKFIIQILQQGKMSEQQLVFITNKSYLLIILVFCCLIVFYFMIKRLTKGPLLPTNSGLEMSSRQIDQQNHRTQSQYISTINNTRGIQQ